nr:gamma-butyrobetaine hydroxylase-like domain-containing protein [Verrucomicrobium spinosum]
MIRPLNIAAIGNEIAIAWEDGRESFLPMEKLRAASPSAENIGERDLLGKLYGGTNQKEYPGVSVTGWKSVGGMRCCLNSAMGTAPGSTRLTIFVVWPTNDGTGKRRCPCL